MKLDLERNADTPLYQRLTEEWRRQVDVGQLCPGDRLPSFSQLREEYGLHKKTVDRAHALLEEDGVIVREKRKGVFVAQRPRLKGAAKTGVIGYCGLGSMLSSSSPYWTELLAGVQEVLQANAMQLLLIDRFRDDVQQKVDGVLIDSSWAEPQEAWHHEKWPCVRFFSARPMAETSSIDIDEYSGQRAATQHLLDLGHRRIAYLRDTRREFLIPSRRAAGYRDALQAADIKIEPRWTRSLGDAPPIGFQQTGRESMTAWLQDDWRELGCTAIMPQNDETAVGVIEAFHQAGIRVPHDVSVVSFDGTKLCEYSQPRLTSVEVPLRAIGRSAAEMLLQQIENGVEEFEHLVLPTRLCVRESTAPPAISPEKS